MSTTSRLSVTLAAGERTAIRARARAHGVSMAAFMRSASLGERPAPANATAAQIDEWWDSLPTSRRAQVYRWLNAPGSKDEPIPGQIGFDVESVT